MEDYYVSVPYKDFIYGITALADLNDIRAIVENEGGYCSDSIMAILGLAVGKEVQDETDG